MSDEKELINKSFFMFLTNGLGKLFLIIANVLMARLLGPEIFGKFIYIYAIITIITIVPTLGVNQGLLKCIPQNELDNNSNTNKSLGAFSLAVTFAASLVMIIIIYIGIDEFSIHVLGDIKYKSAILGQIGLIVLLTSMFALSSLFQARRMMKEYTIAMNIMQNGIFCMGIIVLYMTNINYYYVPVISMYCALSISILYLCYNSIKENFLSVPKWEHRNIYKDFLKYSVVLMFVGSLGIIINKVNLYMIGYYLDAKCVGIYQSAAQIGLITSFLLSSINQVFAPMISKLYNGKQIIGLNNIYSKINYLMLVVSILIISIILPFRERIMLVFGEDYLMGSSALVLIAVGQLINAISGPCGFILSMTGHAKYNMYINIVMLVMVVSINMILIPSHGINGAAISSTFTIIITNVYRVIVLNRKLGIKPFKIVKE